MVFIKIIGVIFILHIFLLVFQYSIAALFVHKNPFKLLGELMPAHFTALGTQSSAATIPVTLEQTKKNGVSVDIAGFVIPLCATIHLSGKYTENRSLCSGTDDDAGNAVRLPTLCRFYLHAGNHDGSRTGSSGRSHHGIFGNLAIHVGFR